MTLTIGRAAGAAEPRRPVTHALVDHPAPRPRTASGSGRGRVQARLRGPRPEKQGLRPDRAARTGRGPSGARNAQRPDRSQGIAAAAPDGSVGRRLETASAQSQRRATPSARAAAATAAVTAGATRSSNGDGIT